MMLFGCWKRIYTIVIMMRLAAKTTLERQQQSLLLQIYHHILIIICDLYNIVTYYILTVDCMYI